MAARGEFSSRLGFVMAAAGSAVGLGNIWGFPAQVASNGGAAFVAIYVLLAFILAYPVLMVELAIGRHSRSNMVEALEGMSSTTTSKAIGKGVGYWGLITAGMILAFYAIVGGWMIAFCLQTVATMLGFTEVGTWLVTFGTPRNLIFCGLFSGLTAAIVYGGVSNGIEKWSSRLMPMLLILLVLLIVYVASQAGAAEGFKAYLQPDFSQLSPQLIISAMGQAFFSLSLGVGTMLIYGSYVSSQENLPKLGATVAAVDIGIAIMAGMLIIPAMYVAQHNGVTIYDDSGALIASDQLVFTVMPALFETIGSTGVLIGFAFFALMAIASLTSSISMLEVPVSYVVEKHNFSRLRAVIIIGGIIFAASCAIIFNFGTLFGFFIQASTEFSEPLIGAMLCVYAGWVWARDQKLAALTDGYANVEQSWFWRVWPWYVKFVCPVVIVIVFAQSVI